MRKPNISQVLVRNLQEAKKKTGLNQQQIAERSGLSQSSVSEIMRGIASPSVSTLGDIAHALGMQAWELLADSDATREAAMRRMLGGKDK